jgi:hypothetical protein
VSPRLIVVPLIRAQQIAKMRLAEDNDMVEAIPSDRTDEHMHFARVTVPRSADRECSWPASAA